MKIRLIHPNSISFSRYWITLPKWQLVPDVCLISTWAQIQRFVLSLWTILHIYLHYYIIAQTIVKFQRISVYLLYIVYNVLFMYFQKRCSQASLLIWIKYFQNWIIMFCLELWFLVEKYSTKCSHSASEYFQTEWWYNSIVWLSPGRKGPLGKPLRSAKHFYPLPNQ